MKKVVYLVVCFILLSAQFVMAGGGQSSSSGGGGNGPTTIKVWSNDAHNKAERMYHVEAFNKGEGAQRGIVVEYTVYGSDYYTALDLAVSAGEEPHLYKNNKTIQRIQEGKILPLTDFPQWYHTEVIDRYRPYMMEGNHTFDGVIYSIPWGGSTYCTMAYNVPLLNSIGLTEPPRSWEEFEKACIAITKANPGKFGTYIPLKYTNFHSFYTEPVLIPSYGHTWFDFTNNRYCFTDFIEYFEMYQRLRDANALFPGMESLDDDTARAQFSEGNIAFVLENPSFNIGVFYDQFPAKMEWKVAPIVVKDPNNYYQSQTNPGGSLSVSSRVKDENLLEQAARVHHLWVSDDMIATLFSAGKDIPMLPEIIAKAQPSDRPQWNDTAKLNVGAVGRPGMPNDYFVVEGDDVHTAFSKIMVGGNAREILADLEKRFNEAYDRAVERGIITKEYFYRPTFEEQLKRK